LPLFTEELPRRRVFSETRIQPGATLSNRTGGAGNKPLSGRISTSFYERERSKWEYFLAGRCAEQRVTLR
jgi:hypothetical protein